MLLYNSSYLCSCGNDLESHLPKSLATVNLKLPDLYFCPKCHILKCNDCSQVEVISKYCCSCMTDYTSVAGSTRCLKNCFECPNCNSPIAVTASDVTSGKIPGKQFLFECAFCEYTYQTLVITKPAPLSKILRANADPRFSKLCEKYTAIRELRNAPPKPFISRLMEAKLDQMKLPNLAPDLASKENFHLNRFKTQEETTKIVLLPLGKHLSAKRSYLCRTCGTYLLTPVIDPRLMKYLEKEFALDVVPVILAKRVLNLASSGPELDVDCVLSVINPLSSSINVNIATVETIPTPISKLDSEISVSLPITSFTVSARREKVGILETIPTQFLTDMTAASRAEKLTRSIQSGGGLKLDIVEGTQIEKGTNWASVGFTYSVSKTDSENLPRIPFYVTVETKMPAKWNSQKKGLHFGFWVLVNVQS